MPCLAQMLLQLFRLQLKRHLVLELRNIRSIYNTIQHNAAASLPTHEQRVQEMQFGCPLHQSQHQSLAL